MDQDVASKTLASGSEAPHAFRPFDDGVWPYRPQDGLHFYASLLDFTAKRLHAQAQFLTKLGECSDSTDIVRCNTEFAREFWGGYVEAAKTLTVAPKKRDTSK
ncbi:hypothetical protein [Marinivivus vitaminiproducens]|uniref:hypothetical protein n=1 Tax=Marinivivus vitaminiproducens TaxID=3035935 RepID=UPI0027A92DA9|nr:hypothetical protein P4R82_23550 [Geminicoccaceae bacterium SCSIO 64248]